MVFKIQNTFTGLFLACCIIHVCSRQVISNGFNPQGYGILISEFYVVVVFTVTYLPIANSRLYKQLDLI